MFNRLQTRLVPCQFRASVQAVFELDPELSIFHISLVASILQVFNTSPQLGVFSVEGRVGSVELDDGLLLLTNPQFGLLFVFLEKDYLVIHLRQLIAEFLILDLKLLVVFTKLLSDVKL